MSAAGEAKARGARRRTIAREADNAIQCASATVTEAEA
jgi:hypothetical protein